MKVGILFVDDDQKILDAMRRTLRQKHNEWHMKFVTGGKEALAELGIRQYDIIISDMQMPVMSGAVLLKKVKELYPEIIRVVLSGYSNMSHLIESGILAHQTLIKPCDENILISLLDDIAKLLKSSDFSKMKKLIAGLQTLPSLPSTYTKITAELNSSKCTAKDIGEIISKDMGMSAKLLNLANSPFFGLSNKISSPQHAVSYLGIETVKSLVLSVGIFSTLKPNQITCYEYADLWKHSFATAVFAQKIAGVEHKGDRELSDNAFMAGLLHDIGMLVLALGAHDKYSEVVKCANDDEKSFSEAEEEIFGTNHASVGAYLLTLWGLPQKVVQAVFQHHDKQITNDKTNFSLTALLLANMCAKDYHGFDKFSNSEEVAMGCLMNSESKYKISDWVELCKDIAEQGRIDAI